MPFTQPLSNELQNLAGFSGPAAKTIAVSGPDGVALAVDLIAVDSMSCSVRELRLQVPRLAGGDTDVLTEWAEALSRRVTYLLEGLGLIEIDPTGGTVLVRSTPPSQQPDGTQFYEIRLHSDTAGNFVLRRYSAVKGTPGRTQVDMQTTHEVLLKLVRDLYETIPAGS